MISILLLEGVGLLTLSDTCRAYASRDILIVGEVKNYVDYSDFVPNFKIPKLEKYMVELM